MNLRASSFPLPISALSAGCIASLVGFGGTVALNVQAAQSVGASPLQIASMITALCLGIGLTGMLLSLWFRIPVVLAWSTPGAALIASNTLGLGFNVAVGCFMTAAFLFILAGTIPVLGKWVARIPGSIASAMLAGVLLPFCLCLLQTLRTDVALVVLALAIFIIARQVRPSWALLITLFVVLCYSFFRGKLSGWNHTYFGSLHLTAPVFEWRAMMSLGLPLFLVTLVSQNLPGMAVLRSEGYTPPVRPLLFSTGLTTFLLAPFGAFSVNMAAITAALCTGKDAHPDPKKRYHVALVYASCYFLLALFSAPLVGLFTTMPRETIVVISGIALLGPLTNALGSMMQKVDERPASVLTFVTTASGVTLLGIGSAFWGLLAGGLCFLALRKIRPRQS